jgi:glutathione S-transferase
VIIEYLEERYPEPPLLPTDPAARALARLAVEQFEKRLGDDYYAFRRGADGAEARLEARLDELDHMLEAQGHLTAGGYGLADIAYLPWIVRLRDLLEYPLDGREALEDWLARLSERPAVAAELGVVGSLPRS